MTTYTRLLAKSRRKADETLDRETLAGHLDDVTRVAALLVERWGPRFLASLGLVAEVYEPLLRRDVPRAAFLHDLGKANEQFQRMVRAPGRTPGQACWHEQVSVWLVLSEPALHAWLLAGCDERSRHAVLAAAAGHHLRLDDGQCLQPRHGSGDSDVAVLTGHPDFARTLAVGTDLLGLAEPPSLTPMRIDLIEPDDFEDPLLSWVAEGQAWWKGADEADRRYAATVKALVIAADVAGSALPRQGVDLLPWTAEALDRVCSPAELAGVVEERLGEATPMPFQRAVEMSPARVTFVRAGCGSGKTAAAYLWAARRASGRKLFFCYPTTGTASQGYEDYVPPEVTEARLVHGRAEADLEDMLENGTGDGSARLEAALRLGALVTWDAPITVCTVDTVLGLVQNNRRGLFSFPAVGNGAFVFDEVHLYDEPLFRALLRFLEAFPGVPVLLMTASLPRDRLAALREAIAVQDEELAIVDGPPELETLERYRLEQTDGADAWRRVESEVRDGGRVLWVANTVDRAVATAQEAAAAGLPVLTYHSRFRYGDRLKRHKAVVDAFMRGVAGGVLAVTTQVCEVSLDMSATLLVSELAPVPALIQRLGRLNRWLKVGEPVRAAPALLVDPLAAPPYTEEELAIARRWLALLGGESLSQANLAAAFEVVSEGESAGASRIRSAWLDGGVFAAPASLRGEGYTVPVVRGEDVAELSGARGAARRRAVTRLTLPLPLHDVAREISGWAREGNALVAPLGRLSYSETFGGSWR